MHAIAGLAAEKGVTSAQLSIAWVGSRGAHVMPLPGTSYVTISSQAQRPPNQSRIDDC